jgi:phasin family protein
MKMATRPKAASAVKAPAPEAAEKIELIAPAPAVMAEPAPETAVSAVEPPVATPAPVAAAKPVPIKHMEKVVKTAEEFVAFGQGNVEAFVKSSQIWVAGVQDLSKQAAATAQAQFDETMSVFKALTSVKSLKDAFELQSAYAKSTMEKTMAESGKLTDASMKLTEQALAPITARVTMAVETFGKAA